MATMFEKPIMKKASEMQYGDIFETEYGDYGNFIKAVFESCEPCESDTTLTRFHYIDCEESIEGYSFTPIEKKTYKVIGKE